MSGLKLSFLALEIFEKIEDEKIATVEISDNVKVKVVRSTIAEVLRKDSK